MSNRKFILFPFMVLATVAGPSQAGDVVAYQGATIETVSKAGSIERGTVLVRDGKIAAAGKDIDIPTDARIVDVSGQTIMPALVDIYHPITVNGLTTSSGSRTVVFNGRTFVIPGARSTSAPTYIKLSDVVDPVSLKDDFRKLSRYGVGFANIVMRGYGQSLHTRVTPDDSKNGMSNQHGTLFLSLSNSTASLNVLRNGLKGKTSSSRSSSTSSRSSSASVDPNSSTELWSNVKEGKTPIILNVNNAATITYVLKIQEEYDKARMVLVASGADIYQTLDQLKDRKLSILLKAGIDIAPRSNQRINVAQMLHDADITFGFSSSLDSSLDTMPDTPLFPVSLLAQNGLDRKEAIKAMTLSPATMLGLEKTVGSIESGKQANLLFLNGDPLDATTTVQQLLVEGKSVYENL